MSHFIKCFVVAGMVIAPLGCEPQPVVETPDSDTTVIERDVEVVEEPATPPQNSSDSDAEVQVEIGGGKGVNVNVQPEANGTDANR